MNAITPTAEAVMLGTRAQRRPAFEFRRGHYGELLTRDGRIPFDIIGTMAACLPERFCDFDNGGRGKAINWALYGWDPQENVAVVQVRNAFRRARNHWLSVRKEYVLVGENENGSPFRHPVSAMAVRGAINAGANHVETVRAAQRWMWSCTDHQLEDGRRQGDLLIVPERVPPKGDLQEYGTEATLAGTHVVHAERIVRTEHSRHLYAVRPRLTHIKGEHRPAYAPLADTSWYTVRVARTAEAWSFAARII